MVIEPSIGSQSTRLTDFIKANRDGIISVWVDAVRTLPVARDLERPLLVDHIPRLLDRICEMADHVGAGREPSSPGDVAEIHARERLEEGFDLAQVVAEYRMLRACILRMWAQYVVAPEQLTDLRALDEAIDISIGASIDRYTRARDRTLKALDRIATEAFGSRTLEELLQRLLHVMKETTSAVDTTAILLREGDLLRVRAAVGLGREAERDLVVRIGEGFAGTVAATARDVTLEQPSEEDVASPILRGAGLHTLYGVPLIEDGEVIGVAHMGSKSAHEFSTQDKRLFAAMVARATSAIRQHMLHEAAMQATKEAQERERELVALADNIPQLAWMADANGARFWFNRRWFEYSGATLQELQGWGWQQFHHPAHAEDVMAKYRHAFATGEHWEDTYPLRGKDGYYHWFLGRAVPIRDHTGQISRWFGTATDITETRLMGEVSTVLTSSLDYDETMTKVARLAVPDFADWCVVDLLEGDDVFRRVAVVHADPDKAEAAHRLQTEYAPRADRAPGIVRAIRTGEAVYGTDIEKTIDRFAIDATHAQLLRTLGVTSYISAPLLVRGRTLGAMTFATSGARQLQRSQVKVAEELARRTAICIDNARMYREAQEASKVREAMLAIVSHELRTPVTTIDLAATMLLHGGAELRLRKPAETIRRACERMDRIIGDLLDMAAIQAGRLRIEPSTVGAHELLNEVVELHEILAGEKGISLIRDFEVQGVQLRCDRQRIQQVFSNLIANAKKFCQAGDKIIVRARVSGNYATFSVTDTGPGIGADELPRVFEAYWSGEAVKKKGTGLGLFIARAIVRAHGGELTVVSDPGDGATFSFTLPIS